MRWQGLVYRALNPVWVADPLSGEGARRFGGRFNARGTPALYTALSPMTAVREVSQIGQPLQPTMLVTYEADTGPVFDGRAESNLSDYDMTQDGLAATDWRVAMAQGPAPTQIFAQRLADDGYAALLVRSFARGAAETDLNLIFFRWGPGPPSRLRLIDDQARLSPAPPAHGASAPP